MTLENNKNEDALKLALSQVKLVREEMYAGGGKKAKEKQKEKNKLLARERIEYLIDGDKPFIEIGVFAGYQMYEEYGGCPAAGTVAGIGYISGKQCVIIANDQTVKAGAWFPVTGKKNLRMQEIAMENNLAETVFFVQRKDKDYDIRWFTPAAEINLCGHATLASAYVLFQELKVKQNKIVFHLYLKKKKYSYQWPLMQM